MKIDKSKLKILWYEDANGNMIETSDDDGIPKGALYQVSRFPNSLYTNHVELLNQEDVDKCKHPRKHVVPTYGWVEGIVGRKCNVCGGSQTKKKGLFHRWDKKWNGNGSRSVFTVHTTFSEDLVLAMVKSGDYKLSEAIILASISCERCTNALRYKYGLDDGYEEYSEEWKKANTSCTLCEEEEVHK
jgi:hypothetical protein